MSESNGHDILSALAPTARTVKLGDTDLQMRGVPLRHVALLLSRHPVLLAYLSGSPLVSADVLAQAPDAAVAIIAAGLGHLGNSDIEQAIDNLAMGQQLDLLNHVVEMTTVGDSFGPFVALIRSLAAAASPADAPAAPSQPETSESTLPPP